MTGYKNYFEGHGEFCVSASSELSSAWTGWQAFNDTEGAFGKGAWITAMNRYTLNNYIDVDPSVAANINGVYGEFLELKLPYKITLDHVIIKSRSGNGDAYGYAGGAAAGNVWGSNDGVKWTLLTSFTGFTYGYITNSGYPESVLVNSTTPYSYFRLQATKRVIRYTTTADGYTNVGELKFFGTREQGQSVLHDGQLTLTKNLNVPRIGPALDADDTPRRDRLVVEYNTSTNPTFEGAVRDTSGRGLDGALISGSSYDATQKALVFDGTDDYIKVDNIRNSAGAWSHSYSVWINLDGMVNETVVLIGADASHKASSVKINNSTQIHWFFYSNDVTFTHSMKLGSWHHLAAVYDGGVPDSSRRMWIDGVELSVAIAGAATALNLSANTEMRIGRRQSSTNHFNGSMSQFKLYDTALTAEEVKTLYDMGQCDEGHHVVNFSKTRVGIGLGDGEAPQAALDVRGDVKVDGSFQCGTGTLRFHTLHGVHPATGNQTVPFAFRGSVYGTASNIISVSGVSQNTNGDLVPWDYHAESSAWEVQAYYDVGNQYFVIFSQGTSTRGNKWSMYIVTT